MSSETIVDTAMKLTCTRDELASQLALVSRGLSSRASVQILSGVLMQVAADRLELAATDMELSIRAGLVVEVESEGSAVVPGRLFAEIVRLLPESEVAMEYRSDENSVLVTSGSTEYRLRTYSVEDFPRLPDATETELSTLDAEPFLDAIACVARAAGRDESRPVLTGVFVHFEPEQLVMVSTDSYRLSVKETPIEGPAPDLEAIIPARALDELRRIAAGGGQVSVGSLDNHVVFGVGDVWLTTRRIDGQFPDYTKLIPQLEDFRVEITMPRSETLDAVRRIALMAPRSSPLRLRLAEGELTVSAQTQDVGEARETLSVAYPGDPLEIGFNADYLRDGIESVTGDEFVLRLIEPLRPGLIQEPGEGFRYLIMPIRLP